MTDPQPTHPTTSGLIRTGAIAGVVAAVATSAAAAVARDADISLEIDDMAIPVGAFAWWTVVGAVVGIVLARFLRERRQLFVVITSVATALSLVPAILFPDDTGTKLVLVLAHLLAAVIIIPALARRLQQTR